MNIMRTSIVLAALAFVGACASTAPSPDTAAAGTTSSDSRLDRPYPYNSSLF